MKVLLTVALLTAAAPLAAHGSMTCNAAKAAVRPQAELVAALTGAGWTVRKAHLEKGCYEVYGKTPEGDRVEAFFDPVSHEKLLVLRRGEVLFKKP